MVEDRCSPTRRVTDRVCGSTGIGVEVLTTGESATSARAQLAALRDVLRRHGLPSAKRVDLVLQGSDADVRDFLMSGELWGRRGSIVYGAGIARSAEAQRECENAFGALGEWQVAQEYVNPDVTYWVLFFRERRGRLQQLVGNHAVRADGLGRVSVPWSVREVWLGVLAAAVLTGVAWLIVYLVTVSLPRIDLDIWVALIPILLELLLLVPVWWYAVRKRDNPSKALGFVGFRPLILAIGVGLLFGYSLFGGLYGRLLDLFGLEVQTDLTPLAQQLSTPWPLIITIVLVAPFVEEVFFRGFVFAGLRARCDWRWAAAISAALFAAAHLQLTFFIPAFVLGCVFAYLYQRSDSVWPGMIMHAAMNALAVAVMYVQF